MSSIRQLTALTLSITLGLAACNRHSDGNGSGGGGANDVIPPVTSALPPGGAYSAPQTVTLSTNEPATIYFTQDGSTPVIGDPHTQSGSSPQGGIQISQSPTTLKFFSVDTAGNVEAVKTQAYTIDSTIPSVSIATAAPGPIGLLTHVSVSWTSTETGTFRVELGGNGTPGSGILLAIGNVTAATPQSFDLRGSQLVPGPAQNLWFIVSDDANNVGKNSIAVALKPLATMLYAGEVRGIAITPNGKQAYVANATTNAVSVIDIDSASPSFHTILAEPVPGVDPSSVTMTPDGTRAYVGSLPGVTAINTTNQGLTPIAVPGGFEVRGIDVTADGKRAYFGRSQSVFVLDTDPGSATFHAAQAIAVNLPGLVFADVRVTPNDQLAVVGWLGVAAYTVNIVDVSPASPTFHTVIGTPIPSSNTPFAHVAIAPNSQHAYVSDGSGKLARVNLTPPFAVDATNPALSVDSVLVSSDGTTLIVLERGFNALRIVRESDLTLIDNFQWPLCGEVGAITPDGHTAYLVRNDQSPIQQLVAVPLD